jgi:hypothetical protein
MEAETSYRGSLVSLTKSTSKQFARRTNNESTIIDVATGDSKENTGASDILQAVIPSVRKLLREDDGDNRAASGF